MIFKKMILDEKSYRFGLKTLLYLLRPSCLNRMRLEILEKCIIAHKHCLLDYLTKAQIH